DRTAGRGQKTELSQHGDSRKDAQNLVGAACMAARNRVPLPAGARLPRPPPGARHFLGRCGRRAACPHAATVPGPFRIVPRWLRWPGHGGVWAPRPTVGAFGDGASDTAARAAIQAAPTALSP